MQRRQLILLGRFPLSDKITQCPGIFIGNPHREDGTVSAAQQFCFCYKLLRSTSCLNEEPWIGWSYDEARSIQGFHRTAVHCKAHTAKRFCKRSAWRSVSARIVRD
jgi:hypothetical protein